MSIELYFYLDSLGCCVALPDNEPGVVISVNNSIVSGSIKIFYVDKI